MRELWAQFAKRCPPEWLDEHSLPCRQLIQQIWLKKRDGDLRFIPWKFLVSESQWEANGALVSCARLTYRLDTVPDWRPESGTFTAAGYAAYFARTYEVRPHCQILLGWFAAQRGKRQESLGLDLRQERLAVELQHSDPRLRFKTTLGEMVRPTLQLWGLRVPRHCRTVSDHCNVAVVART